MRIRHEIRQLSAARRLPMKSSRGRSLVQRAFRPDTAGLGGRVASGAAFQALNITLRTAITIGSMAVLARLLTPADFGYVAMAAVVTEFAGLFANFGFANVLIQRRVLTRRQLETVYWATLGVGVLIGIAVFAASFFAGWLFSDQRVRPLLQVLCLSFPLATLGSHASTIVPRLLRFRLDFWIQTVTGLIRALAAIALAWQGFGAWSLVVGGLVGIGVGQVMAFMIVPFAPRFRFDRRFMASIWKTSSFYFGHGLTYYVSMNVDLLLVGRTMGATALGYYQNARSLTDEIRARLAMPIQQVLFPALSSLQDERQRRRELVLRGGRLLAAVVVPIGIGVAANAPELVKVLYGSQWLAMTPLLATFGLSTAVRSATAVANPIFSAHNRVGLALKFGLAQTALQVAGVALTAGHGLNAVAWSVAITSMFALVTCGASLRLLGLGIGALWTLLAAPVAASALMWLATAAVRVGSPTTVPALALILHVGVGALTYILGLHALSRQYAIEISAVWQTLRRRA